MDDKMQVLKATLCIFWVQLLHKTAKYVIEILLRAMSDNGDMQGANAEWQWTEDGYK